MTAPAPDAHPESIPTSLPQVERAIRVALASLDGGRSASEIVTLRRSVGRLTLRADPRRLKERKVSIEWTHDALSFRRSARQASVPISHFRAHAKLHDQWLLIELSRRDARSWRSPGGPSAAHATQEAQEAIAGVVEALGGAGRSIFLTRALNAVARLSRAVPERTLAAASAAPTDYRALVRALQDPAVVEEVEKVDPLGPARIRGLEARERLLDWGGGTLTAAEAARQLRISRQAVDKRRRAGKLIGLSVGRRGYAYPSWQFSQRGALPGLETVLEALRRHDPWMQMGFMLNKNDWLGGGMPLEELRRGRVDAVVEAALAYGEQGAP